MRILHVITGLGTGGAEASLYKLTKHCTERHAEHIVCSLKGQGSFGAKFAEIGIPVHALNGRPGSLFQQLPSLVRRVRPHLIQGWMYHGNLAALFCRATAPKPIPVVWNIRQCLLDLRHEKWGTALAIRIGALLSNRPHAIVYNSHVAAQQHEAFGFVVGKRHIIDNGFDTNIFKPDSHARRKIRAELGASDEIPLVGCIARFHPMKDHVNFLRAASEIKAALPEAIFVLVGRNTDAAPIAHVVRELGLNGSVRILGERSDVSSIMAALDLLVLSSSWGEAFPNVIGEAMACGVPCVATDVGDTRRIVGAAGVIVPPRDSAAIAHAVESLLQRSEVKTLGHLARQRIISEYSLEAMSGKYSALYAGALAP